MAKPTEQRAPSHTPAQIDDLISQAEAAAEMLPTIAVCTLLNEQLQQALRGLVEQVRARRDELTGQDHRHGLQTHSRDWYACDKLIATAEAALDETMGDGLRSAALHVANLGRCCRALALHISAAYQPPAAGPDRAAAADLWP